MNIWYWQTHRLLEGERWTPCTLIKMIWGKSRWIKWWKWHICIFNRNKVLPLVAYNLKGIGWEVASWVTWSRIKDGTVSRDGTLSPGEEILLKVTLEVTLWSTALWQPALRSAQSRQQSGHFSHAVTEMHTYTKHKGNLRWGGQSPGKWSILCWFPWERREQVCYAYKGKMTSSGTS